VTLFAWFLAGVLSAALHTLSLWWTVTTMRPQGRRPALALVWCGAGLRILIVGAICAAAASYSLRLALFTIAAFALARLVMIRLISHCLQVGSGFARLGDG